MKTYKSLTGKQVLARMAKGDLPTIKGGYSEKSVFEDGAVADGQVMRKLRQAGSVEPPMHSSVHSPWTLPVKLTEPQIKMLASAVEHPDGSVLASGFNHGPHSTATAKALIARGLLKFFTRRCGIGDIYKITDAGRDAIFMAKENK